MKKLACSLVLCAFAAGLRSSEPFAFEALDTDVTLRVHAGSSGRVLGYVIGGVGAAVAGFSLLALGFESVAVDGNGVNHGATSGPVAGLAIGALILAVGGLIILNTRETSFTREP